MKNKDEAVKRLTTVGHLSMAHAEDLYDSFFPKPVVSQCVADWYEGHKDEFEINLYREVCLSEENYDYGSLTDFQKWLISGKTNSFSVLVNMHQFGYEVEKEPRYTVRIKGVDGYATHLNENVDNHEWFFASNDEIKGYRTNHTRKELEDAGFGWVFNCEGVEVKEVDGNEQT